MDTTAKQQPHYGKLDGLRAYAAIGIVLMHVLANGSSLNAGFVFHRLIPSFTDLVFLFMVVSGFAMCCGYYDRFMHNQISLEQFYSKRYHKVWPFFALLCMLDLILSPSRASLYEVFANLTLCFGFLPNDNIAVIGVGWFLGLIFVFYLTFPFFCFLLANKQRAWLAFAVALVLNFLCTRYFFDASHVTGDFRARANILYSAVFFLAGGLVFLYREPLAVLADRYRWGLLLLCALAGAAYFAFEGHVLSTVILYPLLLIVALGTRRDLVLENPFVKLLSSISMEVYLCHMVVFRMLEKLHLLHLFQSDVLSYAAASVATLAGAVLFSLAAKWVLAMLGQRYHRIMIHAARP